MRIADMERHKSGGVVTIHPDASVMTAVRLLRDRRIGALVVTRDGLTVDGIITERDVVHRVAEDPGALTRAVREVMSRHVVTTTPDDTLAHAMAVMTRERCRHLPLLVDGRLAGIVSIGDLVKARLDELELESRVLRDVVISSH